MTLLAASKQSIAFGFVSSAIGIEQHRLFMVTEQILIVTILIGIFCLFLYGRWRYDIVALIGLTTASLLGVVPLNKTFLGFSSPAVITVAAILVISKTLQKMGVVDVILQLLSFTGKSFWARYCTLNFLAMTISAIMNNVGALALLLPVGMQLSHDFKKPSSLLLMPLAFSSILGGMTTLIGTPTNIIISILRAEMGLEPYSMFSFTPVGIAIAIPGVLLVTIAGYFLLPKYKPVISPEDTFEIEGYITEIKLLKESIHIGKTFKEFENSFEENAEILGYFRKTKYHNSFYEQAVIKEKDILVIRIDSETLQKILEDNSIQLVADKKLKMSDIKGDDFHIREFVVTADSPLTTIKVGVLGLKRLYGISLLAVARSGHRLRTRLKDIKLQAGDVVLIRGTENNINETIQKSGCLPLECRGVTLLPRHLLFSLSIFLAAVFCIATEILSPQIAFLAVVLLLHLSGLLKLNEIYNSIDLSILVLIGAMLPLGAAIENSGLAYNIGKGIISIIGSESPLTSLAVILVVTMFLSDIVNNAAAAVLIVPIAVKVATLLGVSLDPFLMAVAIGASCPFLTPIGHQCNTLILGPGGYRFSDYWKLGLPLEIVIVIIALIVIPIVWPFGL